MMDFDPLLDTELGKHAAHGRMLDLRYLPHQLDLGIDDR